MTKLIECCDCEKYMHEKGKKTSYQAFIKAIVLAGLIIITLLSTIVFSAIQLLK